MEHNKKEQKQTSLNATPFAQTYFHGTKADLKIGVLIEAGNNTRPLTERQMKL